MDNLDILPIVIAKNCFLYLDISSLVSLAIVSKKYNNISEIIASYIVKTIKTKHYDENIFKLQYYPINYNEKRKLFDLLQPKIIVVRGFITYQFNPMNYKWTRMSDLRRDRSYFSMLWLDGWIYALGTYSMIASGTAERFNPISNNWSSILPLPQKIRCFGACVFNKTIYVIGGQDVYSNDLSDLIFYLTEEGWKISSFRLPRARFGHSVCVYDNKLWIVGGSYNSLDSQSTTDVMTWDPITLESSNYPNLLKPRMFLKLSIINNTLYAIGGDINASTNIPSSSVELSSIEIFNTLTNEWESVTTFPSARLGYSSCSCNNNVYVFGGNTSSNSTTWDCFDTTTNTWLSNSSSLSLDMPTIPSNGNCIAYPPQDLNWT